MTKDTEEIRDTLIQLIMEYEGVLKVTSDSFEKFEVSGTIGAMQGKKKVEGIYFASVVPKKKDVRFYFFPVYTHKDQLGDLPESLQRALKGKSCFHICSMNEELKADLQKLIKKSIKIYQEEGLLEK